MPFTFAGSTKKTMRKNFTPLLLIPGFIVFFACTKHESQPTTSQADSTAANVYLDPGSVNVIIANNTFSSFNLIHANDTGGFVNIWARALVNKDTCEFSIHFIDTLHTGVSYVNYAKPDTAYIGNDSIIFTQGTSYYSLGFFDDYRGIVYLSNNDYTGNTLLITTFDRSKHLLAGTFKAVMTAGKSESPYITQASTYVTGSFNTYYNTAK